MPVPKTKTTATITINEVKWKQFQKLSKEKLNMAASPHVEQLVEKAIAEMQGKEYDATANLSELQSQSLALVKKAGDVAKVLDSHGVADALDALLGSYGLSHTYANASDVIVKLMALMNTSLKGVAYTKGDLRLLIDIVEYHAKDYVLTAKIDAIRTKQYLKKDDKTTNANKTDQNKATDKIQPLISEEELSEAAKGLSNCLAEISKPEEAPEEAPA